MRSGPSPGSGDRQRDVRPVGETALLVQCRDLEEVVRLSAALTADPPAGVLDVVAAARTVLVRCVGPAATRAVRPVLAALPAPAVVAGATRTVTVEVVYDGADLGVVGDLTGASVEAVVAAHTGQTWTAAFTGFSPGFAYLTGENTTLHLPRRTTPRTGVPAGSVAVGGGFSGIYPRSSPSGWHQLGRTGAPLWQLDREPPALVRTGDRVRFTAVREVVDVSTTAPAAGTGAPSSPAPHSGGHGALTVLEPGPLSLVQDLGRQGRLALGVSRSGALDRAAAVRANRLVGNDRGAAVVETVLGGLRLQANGPQVIAVTGAPAPVTVHAADGTPVLACDTDRPLALEDGQELRLTAPAEGLRSYVAVRGGFAVREVLGSRSTDVLSGLGPPPLRKGTVLPVSRPAPGAACAAPDPHRSPPAGPLVVSLVPGPRADWFTDDSLHRLGTQDWTVTDASNRVGLRLGGHALDRQRPGELPSEGTVAGAVEVPPSGLPVVFLADHPVTGGYPVVGVVREDDLDRLAQARPGDVIRFALLPADGDSRAGGSSEENTLRAPAQQPATHTDPVNDPSGGAACTPS